MTPLLFLVFIRYKSKGSDSIDTMNTRKEYFKKHPPILFDGFLHDASTFPVVPYGNPPTTSLTLWSLRGTPPFERFSDHRQSQELMD